MDLPHFSHAVAAEIEIPGRINVTAPYDQNPFATIDIVDLAGVNQALSIADQCFRDRNNWLPVPRRIEILEKTIHLMQTQADELAIEAAREGGKPLADSKVEVTRAIDGVKICIETLRTASGKEIPMGVSPSSAHRMAFTRKYPIGVVVAVSAFNHPLNLAVHQVAPAVASGCPVIIKPASDTPLSCMRFLKILHEAGLPPEWAQGLITDNNETATALVTDPRVAFFTFIGSAKIGWWLRSQLASGTRCALEHGGVAPVIVADDADLDKAIPSLTKAGLYHAGQVCVSVQRVYAHSAIIDALATGLTSAAEKLIVGDPTEMRTDVGPIIRPAELKRIDDWVQEAIAAGAVLLCGGKALSATCYAPTILLDVPETVTISRKEIFGPVICLYRYDDIKAAFKRANQLDVAFQAAIFTNNLNTALLGYEQLDASAVMVNDHTAFRVDWMPFAGLKESGLGIGGIPHTMHDMQIEKMLVIQSEAIT